MTFYIKIHIFLARYLVVSFTLKPSFVHFPCFSNRKDLDRLRLMASYCDCKALVPRASAQVLPYAPYFS